MNRFTTSQNLLSHLSSGRLLALTAPLVIDKNVLIGYAVSPEDAYCVDHWSALRIKAMDEMM
jgi:hypothetical protein